ncbi:MAG: efflux RND transporter periplasmic adaptor subunit [Acidobacteriota bacterium]|nr:MAG: efflux RND transporter periplasmic adaptor subunit [Acidobacteriota bacterium]
MMFTFRLVCAAFLVMLIVGCSSQESPEQGRGRGGRPQGGWQQESQERALSVRAYVVTRRPISTYIISNTSLESIRDITVYSKLNANVSELNVEEGDAVREGQQLLKLDEREIRNEFEQARIALDQASLAVKQAEVKAELSRSSYDRAASLFEQKLTSREEFDQVELASRTDALALDNAQQQMEAARARLEAARIQLEYTSILSPISGVLTQRLIDVGDRVNVNEALFGIQEFPPLWARIYVPEKSLPQLRLGQVASLKLETYPERQFHGRIKMISPTVDATSGTVKVTIELSQPPSILRPGMFGTVHIATETHQDAVVVPKKAILRERDQNFVFIVQPDNKVLRQEVRTGFSEENWVEIVEGLDSDVTIVTVGVETLSDGYLVAVQAYEGATPDSIQRVENQQAQAPPQPGGEAQSASEQGGERQWGGPGQEGGRSGQWAGSGRGGEMFQRMMQDPEVKKKYKARLKEDPALATDPQKRRAFFREIMAETRGGSQN